MRKDKFENYEENITDSMYLNSADLYVGSVNGFPFIEKLNKGSIFPEIPREVPHIKGYKPGD